MVQRRQSNWRLVASAEFRHALEAAERERDALKEDLLHERRVFAELAVRLEARIGRLEDALRRAADSAVRDPTPHSSAWLVPAGTVDMIRAAIDSDSPAD